MKFTRGFVWVLAALLSACSSAPLTDKFYDGPDKPDADIAIVKEIPNGPINAQIMIIQASTGTVVFARHRHGPKKAASALKVDPGTYYISLRCENGFFAAKPVMKVTFARGSTYSLGCTDVGQNNEAARADVLKVEQHAAE